MKNLLLTFAFIITATTVFSQVKVRPGVKAGFNFSNLTNVENSTPKTGLNGALFLNVHFTRFYELQVETSYSGQGASFEERYYGNGFDPLITTRTYDYELNYMSLGIANKFFPVKNIGLNFIIGPSIDVLVSDNAYNDITPIDLSFFGGIGYEFPFGLGLEVRYKQGIIDVRDDYIDYVDDSGNDYYDRNVLNSVIQVGATYRFSF